MTSPRIHGSHDLPRLELTRARDLAPLPIDAGATPGRAERRPYRSSRHAVLATLRAAQAGAQGAEAAALARRALCVYRGAVRELGAAAAVRGPTIHAHLLAHATQAVVAQSLTMLAAAAGLGTDRGLALLAEAQRAQGRAERSWVAAVAASGLLRGRTPDPGTTTDVHDRVLEAFGDGGEP